MFKTLFKVCAVAALFAVAGFGTQVAVAGHGHDRISIDVGFSIGDLDFDLFFDRGGYGSDGLFLRVSQPYGYDDVGCSDRCYLDGGHRYHHRSCPATRRYLRSHRPRLLSRIDSFARAFFDDYDYYDGYRYRDSYYKRHKYKNKYRRYNRHRDHYYGKHRGHGRYSDDDDDDGGHRHRKHRHRKHRRYHGDDDDD